MCLVANVVFRIGRNCLNRSVHATKLKSCIALVLIDGVNHEIDIRVAALRDIRHVG